MDNYVALKIRATDEAKPDLTELKARLDELRGKVATARAEVDSAQADAVLADLDAKLEAVSKKVSRPKIDMVGASRAAAQVTAVEASMDRLDAKAVESAAVQEKASAATVKSAEAGGAGMLHFKAIAGLAIAGVAYESVKMGMAFQKSMQMLVTQAGVPASHLAALKAGVLDLAGSVGFSPDSLAVSLYHVASNMSSMHASSAQMLSAVKIAAEGAKVGGANLEDVTNALTAAISSGIKGTQDYQAAMGELNATVGSGDMKMQDLADAMGTGMLAAVKGFGLSIGDVGAALATFGDNNIRGAQAGTELRMAVQALAKPAAGAKGALEQLGMTSSTLAGDMQKGGLKLAMEDLVGRMHKVGISATQQGQVLTDAFGKKAGIGIQILAGQFDRFMSKYPEMAKGATDFGAAWAGTQQTLSQQLDELKSGFQALLTGIGEDLIPVVTKLTSFLNRNMDVVKVLVPVLLGVVTLFGLFAMAMKVAEVAQAAWATATKVAAAAQWLLNAAMDANPIGIIIVAIAAVVGAIVLLTMHSAAFREFWKAAWHDIASIFDRVRHDIAAGFGFITHAASEAFGWVKAHWPLILGILLGPIALAVALIVTHWHLIMRGASVMFHDVVSFFEAIPGRITGALSKLPGLLYSAGSGVIRALLDGAKSMIGGALNTVEGWGHDLANAMMHPFGIHFSEPSEATQMVKAGRQLPLGLAKGVRSGLPDFSSIMQSAAGIAGGHVSGYGGGGRGQLELVIRVQPTGNRVIDAILHDLRGEVRTLGGDPLMFQKKVAFR